MRRMLTGLLISFLLAMTALSAVATAGALAPNPPRAQAELSLAAPARHIDAERTQRVLDQFNLQPQQLSACSNACRQNCARSHAACVGSGGRPGPCAQQRSQCLASCGC